MDSNKRGRKKGKKRSTFEKKLGRCVEFFEVVDLGVEHPADLDGEDVFEQECVADEGGIALVDEFDEFLGDGDVFGGEADDAIV